MAPSGKFTKWQQRAIWFRCAGFALPIAGLLHYFTLAAMRGPLHPDPSTRTAALAFGPLVGVAGFALVFWLSRDAVVEFICDESSFRFRKFASTRVETRMLSEIVAVSGMARYGVVTGCRVAFRDGAEAAVSANLLPDGPILGDWLQSHRDKSAFQGFVVSTAQSWQPPEELTRPAPRGVRLTGSGLVFVLLTLFVISGGDGLLWFASDIRRQQAAVQRMFTEGRETQGVVLRRFETHGRGPHYHVTYRYLANGVNWDAIPADVQKQHWQSLQVGSPLAVRYLPSDPATNILSDDPPRIPPLWFPLVLFPAVCALGALILLALLRARRYLSYGVPAPARVIGVTARSGVVSTIAYEFPLASGGTGHGNCAASDPPPEGAVMCILYDPKNTSRSTPYPIALAKVATR